MKCSKCGTLLEDGSNICPNCQNVMSYEDLEEIEELDTGTNINENMTPPTLDVNAENLTSGVVDINPNSNEELYETDPDQKNETQADEGIINPANVDIAIPSVSEVVENADAVTGVVSEQDKEDKKKKIKFNLGGSIPSLYLIIVSFATLIIGMLLGKALFSTGYITSSCDPSNINTKVVADGKNNITYINGFNYKIPNTYLFDKKDNGLLVYDKNGNVRLYIRIDYGSYDNIAISKTSIKESLKSQKIIVNSVEEKKISDDSDNYVVLEVSTTDSKNRLVAFRKYDEERIFYMEVIDTTNNYNNDGLKILDDIANNVEKTDGATLENLDLYDISKLVVNISNEYKALISATK